MLGGRRDAILSIAEFSPVSNTQRPLTEQMTELAEALADGDLHCCDALLQRLGSPPPVLKWMPGRDDLPNNGSADLLDWWHEMRAADKAPPVSVIEPEQFTSVLGNVVLLESQEDGLDFRVRLFGSKIQARPGKDTTGQLISEVWTPLRQYFLVNYQAVCRRSEPLYSRHTPAISISRTGWDRLVLPFLEDGRVARMLVSVHPSVRQDIGREG